MWLQPGENDPIGTGICNTIPQCTFWLGNSKGRNCWIGDWSGPHSRFSWISSLTAPLVIGVLLRFEGLPCGGREWIWKVAATRWWCSASNFAKESWWAKRIISCSTVAGGQKCMTRQLLHFNMFPPHSGHGCWPHRSWSIILRVTERSVHRYALRCCHCVNGVNNGW